jgi:alcohol dehydrogenase class IV
MASFEFATAQRILVGAGEIQRLGEWVREFGTPALVVGGGSVSRLDLVCNIIEGAGVTAIRFQSTGEPSVESVDRGRILAKDRGCKSVVACGGGSVIDLGKAIAALLSNGGEILDYLEVIGRGQALTRPAIPFAAVPTTAGTGAEATRNAVLHSSMHRQKVSLRGAFMLPRLALIDPELTVGLPPALTASTGMDALTQLIEAFVSAHANPFTDAICRQGIKSAAVWLRRAFQEPLNLAAREEMSLASLCSGMALANAGLGAVHGFAAPIGGMFPAPHGAVCAALLAPVTEMNLRALRERDASHPSLLKYAEAAALVTGDTAAQAEEIVPWLRALTAELRIQPLREFGIGADDFEAITHKASRASSMKGNPISLTDQELRRCLDGAV